MKNILEQKYQFLVNNISDTIIELDLKGNFVYIGPQCFNLFGYHQEELLDVNILDLIHPEDLSHVKKSILENLDSGITISSEFRIIHKNGKYVCISARGSVVNANGKQTILAVGRDITNQKEIQNKLKQSEELFKQITDQSFMGFAIFQDFEIKYFNPAFSEVIGYSQEEILAWKTREFFKIIHPDDRNKLISLAQKLYAGDNQALDFLHFRINKKSGQVIWAETKTKPIFFEGKKADMVFIQNITQKKESEEKFSKAFNNDFIAMAISDLKEGRIIECNEVFLNNLGLKREDVIGKTAQDIKLWSDKDSRDEIIRSIQEKGDVSNLEIKVETDDGELRSYLFSANVIEINNEPFLLSMSNDITNRILVERNLKESEEKYRLISENANDLIIIINKNSIVEYINKRPLVRNYGYTPEEILGKDIKSFINPDYLENYGLNVKNLFRRDKGTIELELRHKRGYFCPVEVSVSIYFDINNEPKQLIFVRDTTARKRTEQKLKESEEKYRLIAEDADDLISLYDENYNLEYINEKTHSRILGYSEKELKDLPFKLSIIHKDDVKVIRNGSRVCFKRGSITYQMRLKHKKGHYLWFETKGKVFLGQDDKKKVLYISRDISERKSAEEELKAKELKYRILIENLPQRIFLKDNNFMYISCNNKYADDLNIKADDILGKTDYDFYPKELADKYRTDDIRILSTGKPEEIDEIDILRGKERYVRIIKTPIRDKNDNITGLLGIFWDITERRKVEQQLKESEERFKIIFEHAPDAYYMVDLNGRFIDGNKAAENLVGYKREELIGKSFAKIIPENQIPIGMELLLKNRNGLKTGPDEIIVYHKNGTEIPIEISTHPITINNHTLVLGIARDITERKKSEQKLRESEEKYRNIIEKAKEGYFEVDLKGNYTLVNDAYCKLFEYPREEVVGTNYRSFITEEMSKRTFNVFNTVYRTGIELLNSEYEVITKSGNIKYCESSIHLRYDVKGKKIGFRGFLRDITEKKIAEEKLKESEEKYRNIIENAKEGYFEVNLKGTFTFINEAFCKFFGYGSDEIIGMPYKRFTSEKMAKKAYKAFNDVYRTGIEQKNFEFEIITKDVGIVYGETTIHLRYDSEDNVIGFSGFMRDITERKKAEENLKESEERFRHLFEQSPFSIILFDLNGIILDCNSATERMFGIIKQDIIDQNYLQISYLTPKQLVLLKERFLSLMNRKSVEPLEMRVIRKDGNVRWINSSVSKVRIKNQILFYSIIQDITERKILENLMFELNHVFFNFTADVKKNIQLLVQTVSKLSKGKVVLYTRKSLDKDRQIAQIITSDNEFYSHNVEIFKKIYFMNEIFEQCHELPQVFSDLHENTQLRGDPFIQKYNIKGAFGKIISSQDDYESAIIILYQQNPEVADEDQLVLLLISDAIAIEEQRWQLLQKLEEQNKKLSEIDKLKSEFLRRISHELKTPLISIKGYSELILNQNKEYFDIDTISMIEEITQGCSRLENLIIELLKTSKLETGQIELKTSVEDLGFLIRFTVKELQGLAKTRNQRVILKVHENLITRFEKERIHEVIGNLLTNAIKYTPPYGMIEIKSDIKDNFYIISVKDNGIGFTEEEKEKVFKQFGKIEHYGRGSYVSTEGTGLGLYISKKLVELHGGEIWMESEGRNKGSTFYFSLPIIKD